MRSLTTRARTIKAFVLAALPRGWAKTANIRANLILAALAVLFGSLGQAQAGLMTYSTESSWNSAVSGVQTVAIPDAYTVIDPSLEVNGVTFSQNNGLGNGILFNLGPVLFGQGIPYPGLSDQDPSVGVANILIAFSSPVAAFELLYGTQFGSNVTFTLSNGDSATLSSTANIYGLPNYIGITDSSAFTFVQITTTDPAVTIGNVSFGNLAGGAVPEPSSLAQFGIVTFVFATYFVWWRKQSIQARNRLPGTNNRLGSLSAED